LRALAPKVGKTVLDVGCGSGLFAGDFAALVGSSGKVCGIDVSDDQLEVTRMNCAQLANVELRLGDALAVPYPATAIDAIVSIRVLGVWPRCTVYLSPAGASSISLLRSTLCGPVA
jgi:arsenite methyltransferase